jgi:hypothetical protein
VHLEKVVSDLKSEQVSIESERAAKEAELNRRFSAVMTAEGDMVSQRENIRLEVARQQEDRKALDDARDAFVAAAKLVTWKSSKE